MRAILRDRASGNLIVEPGGQPFTPPVECGLLPGTGRARLLDEGKIRERRITVEQLIGASRLYLVNSVRGGHAASITNSFVVSHPCKQPSDAA